MIALLVGAAVGSGLGGLAAGILLGIRLRGLVPLRMPSNRIRVENAKADARLDVERATAELEVAKMRSEVVELELGDGWKRARAALETARVQDERRELTVPAGDDLDLLLRLRRAELGLTQRVVSARSRLSVSRISKIEGGASPTMDELRDLAKVLDLEVVPATLVRRTAETAYGIADDELDLENEDLFARTPRLDPPALERGMTT